MTRRTCAHPSCDRPAPGHPPDQLCTRHDGHYYHPPVCVCLGAVADGFGQCVQCWHPIISLHPGLISGLRIWPHLLHQTVVRRTEQVA